MLVKYINWHKIIKYCHEIQLWYHTPMGIKPSTLCCIINVIDKVFFDFIDELKEYQAYIGKALQPNKPCYSHIPNVLVKLA